MTNKSKQPIDVYTLSKNKKLHISEDNLITVMNIPTEPQLETERTANVDQNEQ